VNHEEDSSELVGKGPCDKCGSSDARAIYSDGHSYCFVCSPADAWQPGDGQPATTARHRKPMAKDLIQGGEYRALVTRKISEETCRKFGYKVTTLSDGRTVQVAPYYTDGQLTGQKVRPAEKDDMFSAGSIKGELFGQQLWSQGGRKIVVTEGEIDCMSVSQVQGNKWPVVSVPNGAAGAPKALARNVEWLSSFGEVILMFDMDSDGKKAAAACAALFPPGKVKIAQLPHKDPNECLQKGDTQAIISAIFNSQPYRPDGLLHIRDIAAQAKMPPVPGIDWAWPTMTAWTYGRRETECYGFGAGTGVGKTDLFTQQIEFDVNTLKKKVGLFYLEQNPVETLWRLAGKMKGKAFHVDDGTWTLQERSDAIDELASHDLITLYQSFGRCEWDTIKGHIRFLAVSEGIKHFYLDHLTALADPANERESLEIVMEEMASMANELRLIFHYVSHLSTPEGKSHEEGGRVLSKHFKGARAIAFWSHFMFGLERNKLADDPEERTVATLRCIKDRMTGRADGETLRLKYDRTTCRLNEEPKATSPRSAEVFNTGDAPDEDDCPF